MHGLIIQQFPKALVCHLAFSVCWHSPDFLSELLGLIPKRLSIPSPTMYRCISTIAAWVLDCWKDHFSLPGSAALQNEADISINLFYWGSVAFLAHILTGRSRTPQTTKLLPTFTINPVFFVNRGGWLHQLYFRDHLPLPLFGRKHLPLSTGVGVLIPHRLFSRSILFSIDEMWEQDTAGPSRISEVRWIELFLGLSNKRELRSLLLA